MRQHILPGAILLGAFGIAWPQQTLGLWLATIAFGALLGIVAERRSGMPTTAGAVLSQILIAAAWLPLTTTLLISGLGNAPAAAIRASTRKRLAPGEETPHMGGMTTRAPILKRKTR